MRIGFIGLGAMGAPMAARMATAGHEVRGFDLRPAAVAALAAKGVIGASSARDAASGAELLWLMPVNGAQAAAVLFEGEGGGAAAVLQDDAVVVAACTQSPDEAHQLGRRIARDGRLAFLDAPVSGGVAGAKSGSLTVMCSGPPAAVARARPVFDAVAGHVFHLGSDAGAGSTAKMINQLLCGVHIAAAAEAMAMAERAGIALATIHEIISLSAGNSWAWGDRGPRMMSDDPPVTSAIDIFVKDLAIVLDQSRRSRQALPLASAAMQMFLAASGLGHGAADDSQVIRAYRALSVCGVRGD